MDKHAILHIPMSQYAFALSETEFVVRIRTAKGDIDSCTLFYGDRACMQSPVVFQKQQMEIGWQDEFFDFFEVKLSFPPKRICYYFKLEKGNEWTFYYADLFRKELPDQILLDGTVLEGRSEYYQYPYILRKEILGEPDWFQEAVVYNIFPDSFASKKRYLSCKGEEIQQKDNTISKSKCGGTIQGIIENLDYLSDMGFNCVYLNPVFVAGEYHKYDIVDYFHIDPCFGTDEDFMKLTEAVHMRHMHIIIDGVFNHCSWYFPFFNDVVEKGKKSIYVDWFYDLKFPIKRAEASNEIPDYACFAYEKKMPKLNTSNKEVQKYFAHVGAYWIEKFHVDGWRLDVANEVDKMFWTEFRDSVKHADPNAILIGEVWENSQHWLRGDAFDSTMNYDFRKYCRDFFAYGKIDALQFGYGMTDMQLRYPIQLSRGQLNLLDSHDVPRFLSLCKMDIKRWKLAFVCLMMSPGVPSVFYGDENLISGICENQYRSPMPWEKEKPNVRDFVKNIISIRKQYIQPTDEWENLTDGKNNVLKFQRIGRYRITVLMNLSENAISIGNKTDCAKVLSENGLSEKMLNTNCYCILCNKQQLVLRE